MDTKNEQSVGQTHEQGQSQGVAAVASGSASDLLRQWIKAMDERSIEMENRENDWLRPRPSIEEALGIARQDLNFTMWFLDRTLKLLAAHEQQPNGPSEPRGK
jgi:hypothetical protein